MEDCQSFENSSYTVLLCGYALDRFHNSLSVEDILCKYAKSHDTITGEISGCYLIFIFEKSNRTLHIFQNSLGSFLNLYYTVDNNVFYCSTSLSILLEKSGRRRELDESVILHFLLNGYVVGAKTLIKDVKKLTPGCFLSVNDGAISVNAGDFGKSKILADEAAEKWNGLFKETIRSFSVEASSALSGGYDSNFILHNLSELSPDKIKAYSIGGEFEGNELPIVEKIAQLYPNLELKTAKTDSNTFLSFPDLVCRFDGQIFESGIFLQYELAKLVAGANGKSLICGECANEIMSSNYYNGGDYDIIPQDIDAYTYDPYISAAYLIIKKSGIVLNSFGISSYYPFADQSIIDACHALRYNSGCSKAFHVSNCKAVFSKELFSLLANRPGATKVSSLMGDSNCERLDALILDNEYYRNYCGVLSSLKMKDPEFVYRTPNYNLNIRNPFKLMRSEKQIRQAEWMSSQNEQAEISLKIKLSCLYLDLFNKLYTASDEGSSFGISAGLPDIYPTIR